MIYKNLIMLITVTILLLFYIKEKDLLNTKNKNSKALFHYVIKLSKNNKNTYYIVKNIIKGNNIKHENFIEKIYFILINFLKNLAYDIYYSNHILFTFMLTILNFIIQKIVYNIKLQCILILFFYLVRLQLYQILIELKHLEKIIKKRWYFIHTICLFINFSSVIFKILFVYIKAPTEAIYFIWIVNILSLFLNLFLVDYKKYIPEELKKDYDPFYNRHKIKKERK